MNTLRKPHLMKPLDKITRPTRLIFVDTETKISQLPGEVEFHTLRLGYALHCKSTKTDYLRIQSDKVITDCLDFWSWIDDLCYDKSSLYMVAHNWHFDATVLKAFEFLPAYRFELVQWYTKQQTWIMHWKREKCHLTMIDNGNIFNGTLKKLGEQIGLAKGEVDFYNVEDKKLLEYCKNDVEIMRLAWIKWLEYLDDNNCGDFRFTIASQALETFRYRFMQQYIFIHGDEPSIILERQAYHGGRVEAKFVGHSEKGPFYYLDVNNMYGFVMAEEQYPCGFYHHIDNPSIDCLEFMLYNYAVVAEVELETSHNPFPCISDKKLIYPTGHFTTTLCTPELKYAADRDWICSVKQLSYYPQRYLFKEYIEYFYNLRLQHRKEGNKIFELIDKLFNNSLYGKFGSKQSIQRKIGDCPSDAIGVMDLKYPELGLSFDLIYLGGSIFEVEREGEGYNSFCAIAAHVTAYARMYLWSLISQVEAYHYFYSDTDSLIVDNVGYCNLAKHIDDNTLGKLKVECQSSWLSIHAPKDYNMQGRNRIKGVTSKAIKIDYDKYQDKYPDKADKISRDEFEQIAVYEQQRWPKLASRLREKDVSNYTVYPQLKHLKREVTWGILATSGWVSPFVLE